VDHAPLHLVVDLDRGVSERLPDPQFWEFDGHSVRLLPGQDVVALRHVVLLVLRGDYDCRTP
jgi:hypothetical protein